MATPSPPSSSSLPRITGHIIAFARALRTHGVAVGPAQVLEALRCVHEVGLATREDTYWSLHAALVRDPETRACFDSLFDVFFAVARTPQPLQAREDAPPPGEDAPPLDLEGGRPRLDDGRGADRPASMHPRHAPLTVSDRDTLGTRDFAQMTSAELAQAEAAIAQLLPTLPRRPTRRQRPSPNTGSRIDLRATLREGRRYGGELAALARVRNDSRQVPVVLLCDVSGSMAAYSRAFLHFAHALTLQRREVFSFVFSTRLSHVTRALSHPSADLAVARVSGLVPDWDGGTRIADCLGEFNRRWAHRVLAGQALVVLLSDGLEREAHDRLGREAARLQRLAHRWLWLNPLLRYAGFEARANGIRALLPHVDEMRSAHNLRSLEDLARLLAF
ncbi:MAG: VWA domain-containing protein [Pseudomonadota bacterium]